VPRGMSRLTSLEPQLRLSVALGTRKMKPVAGSNVDHKALVRNGYNECAERYARARASEPSPILSLLLERLSRGAAVLDLGCGSGVPVTRALAEKFRVTGVDFSSSQLELARRYVPEAKLIEADIARVDFPRESFDAVVAFYTLFHLPLSEQRDVLDAIGRWLRPGGYFLGTVSEAHEEPYTEDDFFGVSMYWANYSAPEYEQMLCERGFRILGAGTVGHGFEETRPEERHPWVFAQKR
jgi:SAM-dependent methyltransferase